MDPKIFHQLAVSKVSPILIGSLLNFFFFGILLVQVYIYRVCFSKDSWIIKSLVYFILFAITLGSCLNASDASFWYVTSFGDVAAFGDPRFANFYSPIMGSFIAMLVHFFFCFRIFVIRRAVWPVCIPIALVTVAQFVGGLASGAIAYQDEFGSLQDRVLADFIYLWLTGGAVADVLIAVIMTTLILKADMHSSTRDVAKDIVHLILETNTFSAVVDLLALSLFVAFPSASYCNCPGNIIPGIYANTLLATLNNRAIILRNRTNEPLTDKMEMSPTTGDAIHANNVSGSARSVGSVRSVRSVESVESIESITFAERAGFEPT
ncbi:hypothetical protein B0H12DRAFT_1327783 [Mycena haematopus]|nr:hypothetical protein B0H12DRAFT_1327783 [Mycena haematopus]